tara:strand:- start:167 stop:832 length:666 start_codon:yes stop_codon:yes gene_type:complete
MSERLLGAIVATHGDDQGLIMPPSVAPIQVIVIPIIAKNSSDDMVSEAEKIVYKLKDAGIRARMDARDIRPGQKYYDWEIKGVPLRIEIGPRDLANDSFMSARRTGGKESHPLSSLVETVHNELQTIGEIMSKNSIEHFNSCISDLPSFSVNGDALIFDEPINTDQVYEMAFEGNDAEAEMIENSTGLTFLGNSTNTYSKAKPCVITGKSTHNRVYLARTY